VRLWADGEWVVRGEIMGGGPFVSEDRIVELDLDGVEGDTLRVRLEPPSGFWRLDWFAVDYSDDAPFDLAEVGASSIVGDDGRDLSAALGARDGEYYVMPRTGQSAALAFPAPAPVVDRDRTVFAKVTGYYDIHLDARGRRRTALLGKIFGEPGYVVAYSLKELADWRAQH